MNCVETKSKDFLQRCSVCKGEVGRMSANDKLAWARRTIERAVKGEKVG